MELSRGKRIDEKFEIEDLVGRGGMGYVVRARHLVLDRTVALKFLSPAIASLPQAVARFVREARAATRITNEHVVRVLDVARLPNGEPYMVMEYLAGRDLSAVLATSGRLAVDVAVDCVLQACVALAEAHVLGIIHRDLKPSNLFLTERSDGRPLVKVLDFGISKVLLTEGMNDGVALTETSALMGSPLYSSPEQLKTAKGVTPASDIWSFGVLLYELLTTRNPFEAETFPEVCAAVITDPPISILRHRPELPPALWQALARCLEKPPERRWPNVLAFAESLLPFASANGAATVERIRGIVRVGQRASDPGPVSSRRPVGSPSWPSIEPPRDVAVTDTSFVLGGVVRRLGPHRMLAAAVVVTLVGVLLVVRVIARPAPRTQALPPAETSAPASPGPEAAAPPAPAAVEPPPPQVSAKPPASVEVPAVAVEVASAPAVPPAVPPAAPARTPMRPTAPSATASAARARRYGGRE